MEGMVKQLCILLAFVSAAAWTVTADSKKQINDEEVLDKWLGKWRYHLVSESAAWSPIPGEHSGTSSTEWILDGHFQQTSSKDDGTETREIRRYDAKTNTYHKWTFNSYGSDSFWTGGWDEESSTMTWQYVDFGPGITGEIVDHFSSPGKYKTRLVMKDPKGNMLLDVRIEHVLTRKEVD
jgi:hypothetical protein